MITNYHRPETIEEALNLLKLPATLPMGGGTGLNSPAYRDQNISVVDLQSLNLNHIRETGSSLEIGATVTLQQLLESPNIPAALQEAIRQEATLNIRNAATVAGALAACDGRSAFGTMMLALDAKLTIVRPETSTLGLAEYWALRPKGLITQIEIPLNVKTAYEQVARTPADLAIVAAGLAQWNSGRTRLALGGYGKIPLLAMDGTEADGLAAAAKNTFHEAIDAWASAEYRMDVAATLAKRCLEAVQR
ncbi:MAG: FAD binding domain-containing protein [Anaerolineales bacterium]|jgi:probable selenate reductase FAD-binding subunit|nr:FAD binding domain-containing protein [Anaerolineales bacterium]